MNRRTPDTFKDIAGVDVTNATAVWTPTSGMKVRLMSGSISVNAACSVLFRNETGNATVFRTPILVANAPYSFDLGSDGVQLGAADDKLDAISSTGATVTGTIWGTTEAP